MRLVVFTCLAIGVVGCDQPNAIVVIDVTSPATLPALRLHCVATANHKTATFDLPASGTFTLDTGKTFAVTVPNADAGSFAITMTAEDGNGQPLATGQGATTTRAGKRADIAVVLGGGVVVAGDGGSDAGTLDMTAGVASFTVTPSATAVMEHQSFSLHIVALDAGGNSLLGYAGAPALTSDWGDCTIGTQPVFVDGAADATVSLDRETNPSNLTAHVTVTDGAAVGRTAALTVTAPQWVAQQFYGYSSPGVSGGPPLDIRSPSMLITGTGAQAYRMFFDQEGIQEVSGDGQSWTKNTLTGVDGTNAELPSIAIDGANFLLAYHDYGQGFLAFAKSTDADTWSTPATAVATSASACGAGHFVALLVDSAPAVYRLLVQSSLNTSGTICEFVSSDSGATWTAATSDGSIKGVTGVYFGGFVKEGSVYKLWFFDGSVAQYATSSDAINWTLSSSPTILAVGVAWNASKGYYEGLENMGSGVVTRLIRN